MSRATYVLLPPSESKVPGGTREYTPGRFDSALGLPRERVRQALAHAVRGASRDEASKLLKVRGPLLDRALQASRDYVDASALLLPAWQRYDGVVWTHLDAPSLQEEQRERLLIPSALYGLSSATDMICEYRLTMKVALDGLGGLAKFWRSELTAVLENLGDVEMVSFLPKEHAAAIDTHGELSNNLVTVSFVRHDGEGVAGHDAKAAKGAASRRVVQDGLGAIEGFRWKGWRGKFHRGQYVVRAPRERVP